MSTFDPDASRPPIAFIGGGNMAGAIVGGLVRSGRPPGSIRVIDPGAAQRAQLEAAFGVPTAAAADAALAEAAIVVWAVKPQVFEAAAGACAGLVGGALQLSVMAGVRIETIARATGAARVVRAMPNTPALIGRGIAGLCASEAVDADGRALAEAVLAPTGECLWVEREQDLDAVTALSGSGPAYVFYFLEAMVEAARRMGFDAARGRQLALATFAGGTALAQASAEPLATLRERVTSPGGTTHAAISSLEAAGVRAAFIAAIEAARRRAEELGGSTGAAAPNSLDRPDARRAGTRAKT